MTRLRIGGVPEHFNFPWLYAIENDIFKRNNIELTWISYPGGTGAMSEALKNNEIDVALLLTEGALKEISAGAPFKMAETFVESPLIWGIHSGNKATNLDNLKDKRYAISRLGSGSHLMAYVHAMQHNILLEESQMVIVGNMEGARKALKEGSADLFFWEKFMTKPLVDSGEFFLSGEIPTPWPCFMLVCRNDFYAANNALIKKGAELVRETIKELRSKSDLELLIAKKFNLQATDVTAWLSLTRWSQDGRISTNKIETVFNSLKTLQMANGGFDINTFIFDPSVLI